MANGRSILFRTAEGTKLHELLANASVVFEADERGADAAWSVVVKGAARALETAAELEEADQQELPDWHPTRPFVYVRITPSSIRGRRYKPVPLAAHQSSE